ncbi:MAG TPA: hypothetical protein VHP32_05710 [Ignavibacteria bacterium]|nr:hypothetical protein [Ignavibacteria bacterium]
MDFNDSQTILYGVIISNIVALIMLLCSWKKPKIARVMFFLLFIWAGWVNAITALNTPQVYLEYSKFAFFPIYSYIIEGFFGDNITAIVFSIAMCQLMIGVSMLLKGRIFVTGAIGGMIFLICISPLGFGSGFPSTLIMAWGLYLLLNKNRNIYLWESSSKNPDLKIQNP